MLHPSLSRQKYPGKKKERKREKKEREERERERERKREKTRRRTRCPFAFGRSVPLIPHQPPTTHRFHQCKRKRKRERKRKRKPRCRRCRRKHEVVSFTWH